MWRGRRGVCLDQRRVRIRGRRKSLLLAPLCSYDPNRKRRCGPLRRPQSEGAEDRMRDREWACQASRPMSSLLVLCPALSAAQAGHMHHPTARTTALGVSVHTLRAFLPYWRYCGLRGKGKLGLRRLCLQRNSSVLGGTWLVQGQGVHTRGGRIGLDTNICPSRPHMKQAAWQESERTTCGWGAEVGT